MEKESLQTMQPSLNSSLLKIAKGTGIGFFGLLIGLFSGFIGRLLVARYGTEAEYGVFSLAFVILSICAVIGTLGLQQGATRSIAFARGRNEIEKVQKLISASIQFGLLASISLSIIVFLASDIIATKIFHDAALAFPLKMFAFGIPCFTLINVFVSLFRGFDDVKPQVYFKDILTNAVFPLLLLPVILLNLPFDRVFYAFLASLVIPCIALITYATKRLPSPMRFTAGAYANPVAKELFVFSLPLFGVTMLQMIILWTDTLMLGGLKSSAEVGLYNAAHPLARFISFPLAALLLIYTPITSGLYARGLMSEMRRNFSILTKWLCSATLPLFLILFLFPETVLNFLFGATYAPAAIALRILSLGFIVNNLLGPNGATLIALGKSQFMMYATLATAALNIGLNIALIPPLGIKGAAIASITAITCINLIRCWKLYSLSGAQPLSKNLIKPALLSLALVLLIYSISRSLLAVSLWMLPLLFILYCAIYALAIVFTKSLDQEDITMLLAMEKRTGVSTAPVRRILRRFL